MTDDWPFLITIALMLPGAAALALILAQRGRAAAETTRLAAERARDREAAIRAAEDAADRRLSALRHDMAERLHEAETRLVELEHRVAQAERGGGRAADAVEEGLRAQLRATLDAADRQLTETGTRLRQLEQNTEGAIQVAKTRLASLAEAAARQIEADRAQAAEIEASAQRQITAARAEMALMREGGLPVPATVTDEDGNPTHLTQAQGGALAHVYWELEAVAEAARRNLAALPGPDGAALSEDDAAQARDLPPLPAEPMRVEIEVLGAETAIAFDTVVAELDRLHAGEGPAEAGALRAQLAGLLDSIAALLERLEAITAVEEV